MSSHHLCIAYTTTRDDHTVTIDYDKTLRLFLTEKERLPFSAEKILAMLNGWAKVHKVQVTVAGRWHITVGDEAHCILTQRAIHKLLSGYHRRHDWQAAFPFVSAVLPYQSAENAVF
ncbi:hypothetical protein KDA_75100 [Dictyobacter alpinus]|uniref:Uncharacterized protein n=1 Tax=Dictyobacter alpinus TaxID=2014873 RepID=A0A402BL25_9CHLR|nr:hypothetical protein [Dictyobacter alpinus]GCE32026.1 hypothetical protein KDA_75100 [Dictyobacter alpinus]